MQGVIDIVASLFSFDIVRLRERLTGVEDRRAQAVLILLTMFADTVRFFVVTCLFVLVLY